jgi:hypothetical protein
MSEAVKNQVVSRDSDTELDGFAGYEDRIEGDDAPRGGGAVIQGTIAKFNNEGDWVTSDGDNLSPNLKLVASGVARIVQKWLNGKPVGTIFLAPDQKFPDVKVINDKAPRSEWREGLNGEMVGPWQAQQVLYLVDPESLNKFSYPTSTIGGNIAIRELVDKVKWKRKHCGPHVHAVVTLSDMHMNTRFGGRQRPHFEIVGWIGPNGEELSPAKPLAITEELNDDLSESVK